jgi:hypothetical protein
MDVPDVHQLVELDVQMDVIQLAPGGVKEIVLVLVIQVVQQVVQQHAQELQNQLVNRIKEYSFRYRR